MNVPKILVLDRNDELAEQIRRIVEDRAEVSACTRVGANHINEHEGPISVFIAGPSLASRAGLRRLAVLHRELPASSFLIAFAKRPTASLRDIVQVGADDLVELPVDDLTLRSSVLRCIELAEQRAGVLSSAPEPSQMPAYSANGEVAEPRPLGKVVTVSSASGGCGKTFYATNTAYLLSQAGARVALIDLDLQFGEVSTALRLQPTYTIVDVLKQDESGDLASHIDEYLVSYGDHFKVLATPRDPAEADRITPVEVTRIIEALRTRFDYVIVDTPAALAETVLAAFDVSEKLYVMATLDLPSVRNLGIFLQTLEKLRIPSDNISLVLNKVESDVGISVEQIVKLFPQGFRSTLPYAREVSKSINMGEPVLSTHPQSEVSKRLVAGLTDLLPEGARSTVPAERGPKVGLLSRFFKRPARAVPGEPVHGGTR